MTCSEKYDTKNIWYTKKFKSYKSKLKMALNFFLPLSQRAGKNKESKCLGFDG